MVGLLPAAPTEKKFILIDTDYFTKWIETETYANVNDKDVMNFLWKNSGCRFGIPWSIVSNNDNFAGKLKIKHFFSIPWNLQSHGQAKITSKTLISV